MHVSRAWTKAGNYPNKIFARDWRAFNLVLVECKEESRGREEKRKRKEREEREGGGVKWIWHRARASDGVETGSEWIGLV